MVDMEGRSETIQVQRLVTNSKISTASRQLRYNSVITIRLIRTKLGYDRSCVSRHNFRGSSRLASLNATKSKTKLVRARCYLVLVGNYRSYPVGQAGARQLPPHHPPFPKVKALINAKVAPGHYRSASEVIKAALRPPETATRHAQQHPSHF